jgi:hypothetical protein
VRGLADAFLPQLRTLLETLELSVAWDVRRTLYEDERKRQHDVRPSHAA